MYELTEQKKNDISVYGVKYEDSFGRCCCGFCGEYVIKNYQNKVKYCIFLVNILSL